MLNLFTINSRLFVMTGAADVKKESTDNQLASYKSFSI